MKYDFETIFDRTDTGSSKWAQMKKWNPNVSKGIVPFSVADMEFKTPPEVVEGLKAYLDTSILGYTIPYPEYLEAVCGWMARRHNWKVDPDTILCSAGVVSAFFTAIKAYSSPGDGIIVQTPVYYPFFSAIKNNNRTIVRNPLIFSEGRYTIDYDDLEKKCSDPANKILLFCSPHNPVGRVWTKKELEKVGEICLRHKVLIISDEIHFDLVMPGYTHTVFASISDELADAMIVCTAPSKTFNLAGLQTSNIMIRNPALRKQYFDDTQKDGFFSLGTLGYKSCELAYTKSEAWLDEFLRVIYRNHQELMRYFEKNLPQLTAFPIEGTYLQWMDFRNLGLDKDALEQGLHKEAQLFFDEGYIFGDEGAGFERWNLACSTLTMMKGLDRLKAWVDRFGK